MSIYSNMLSRLKNVKETCEPQVAPRPCPLKAMSSVCVTYVDKDGSFWVVDSSEKETNDRICQELASLAAPDEQHQPETNQICAAFNTDGSWYRARILSTSPIINVHFIDYGDEAVVSSQSLAPLPASIATVQPLAKHVKLTSDSYLEPTAGMQLIVQSMAQEGDVTVVDVVDEDPTGVQGTVEDVTIIDVEEIGGVAEASVIEHNKDCASTAHNKQSDVNDKGAVKSDVNDIGAVDRVISCKESSELLEEEVPVEVDIREAVLVQQKLDMKQVLQPDSTQELTTPFCPVLADQVDKEVDTPLSAAQSQDLTLNASAACFQPSAGSLLSHVDLDKEKMGPIPTTLEVEHTSLSDATSGSEKNSNPSSEGSEGHELGESSSDEGVLGAEIHGVGGAVAIAADFVSTTDVDSEEFKSDGSFKLKHEEDGVRQVNPSLETVSEAKLGADDLVIDLPDSQTGDSATDPFISALGRYPHLGGGYGVKEASEERNFMSEINNQISQLSINRMCSFNNEGSSVSLDDDYDWQSFTTTSTRASSVNRAPAAITKGRKQQGNILTQGQHPNPQASIPSTGQSRIRPPSISDSKSGLQTHISSPPCSSTDFKAILDFEFAILREQNRLQMLQMQKQMEKRLSTVNKEMSNLRDEMTRQLAGFSNEVNSRLMIVHESVVQKVAQLLTDLGSLKSEVDTMKQSSMPMGAVPFNVSSQPQQNQNMQHQMQPPNYNGMLNAAPYFQGLDPNSGYHVGNAENAQAHFHKQGPMKSKQENIMAGSDKAAVEHKVKSADRDSQNGKGNVRQVKNPRHQQHQHYHQNEGTHNNQFQHQQTQYQHQPRPSNHSKVDHFEPSQAAHMQAGFSSSHPGVKPMCSSVVLVSNLDAEKFDPDMLFNLFGVCGIVHKIKIDHLNKGKAFIQMAEPAHAEAVIQLLNGMPLMGQHLKVAPCSYDQIKVKKEEYNTPSVFKDYSKPNLQRLQRFKPDGWSARKVYPPSQKLLLTNILSSVTDEEIKAAFAKNGFNIQEIFSQTASGDERKLTFVTFGSVEEAAMALMTMHHKELSDWMRMRITFARY